MNNPDYLISTPENVDLHIDLAGLGNRIFAAFIDTVVSYLLIMLLVGIALLIWVGLEYMGMPRDTKSAIGLYLLGITSLLCFCVQYGYYICLEGLWQGQTIGKKLANIRVIESNGQPVTWASVWIRNLLRFIDMTIGLIGLIVMMLDKNERRIGDFAANTLVIRERSTELSSRILRLRDTEVPPSFVDVGQMSPDEYNLLLTFLKRRHSMLDDSRKTLARQMEEYFKIKLCPQVQGESSEELLEKLYVAYAARAELEKA